VTIRRFFISIRPARGNDTKGCLTRRVYDSKEKLLDAAECHHPALTVVAPPVLVLNHQALEYVYRVNEVDPVLPEIRLPLRRIPLEGLRSVYTCCVHVKTERLDPAPPGREGRDGCARTSRIRLVPVL
jgi:hypothetical protein